MVTLYLLLRWEEWCGTTLKHPTDIFLSCWAHLESWILCLLCPGTWPKSKGAMVVYKNKSQSVDKHFTLLLAKVMLHLVEFLGWHHRGKEGGDPLVTYSWSLREDEHLWTLQGLWTLLDRWTASLGSTSSCPSDVKGKTKACLFPCLSHFRYFSIPYNWFYILYKFKFYF